MGNIFIYKFRISAVCTTMCTCPFSNNRVKSQATILGMEASHTYVIIFVLCFAIIPHLALLSTMILPAQENVSFSSSYTSFVTLSSLSLPLYFSLSYPFCLVLSFGYVGVAPFCITSDIRAAAVTRCFPNSTTSTHIVLHSTATAPVEQRELKDKAYSRDPTFVLITSTEPSDEVIGCT